MTKWQLRQSTFENSSEAQSKFLRELDSYFVQGIEEIEVIHGIDSIFSGEW